MIIFISLSVIGHLVFIEILIPSLAKLNTKMLPYIDMNPPPTYAKPTQGTVLLVINCLLHFLLPEFIHSLVGMRSLVQAGVKMASSRTTLGMLCQILLP